MAAQTPTFSIAATDRTLVGKQSRQLRSQGLIPAVVYGHNKPSRTLAVNERDFLKVYKEAGSSSLIDLSIGGEKSEKVLVQDIQVYAPTNSPLHIDFYLVNMKEKLQTEIELEFVGVSPAVETDGGTLITSKSSLNVECLPQDLVASIEVDISAIVNFDTDIRVKDIKVPAGIELLDDAEDMIVTVHAPRSEEELAELEAVPDATVEVESVTGNEPVAEEGADEKK